MTYAKAAENKFLHVYTNIGKKEYHFQCKTIEELANGFRLNDVKDYDEKVIIVYAPVIITRGLRKRAGGAMLV